MMVDPVKGRSEAGRRRQERARQTRSRIVDAARDLFLRRGYAATTVEAIAQGADVATATVYQAFGSKHAILSAGLDIAVAGDHAPVAVLDREWVLEAAGESDPRRRLAAVVSHACEMAARTAPIKEVIRDAAALEPAMGELVRQDHARRRATQEALVDLVVGQAPLRAGLDRRKAVDIFFTLVNSDTHRLMVDVLRWSAADWERWLVRVLEHELFEPADGTCVIASP